jgi:hypothetical protein
MIRMLGLLVTAVYLSVSRAVDWDDEGGELRRLRRRCSELENENRSLKQDAVTNRVLWKAQQKTLAEARKVRPS